MIKKFIVMLMCVSTISLTACGANYQVESEKLDESQSSMFVYVERTATGSLDVVYHKDTKVMYVVSTGAYNRGTFTLLVNPDGTPMLWEDKE